MFWVSVRLGLNQIEHLFDAATGVGMCTGGAVAT